MTLSLLPYKAPHARLSCIEPPSPCHPSLPKLFLGYACSPLVSIYSLSHLPALALIIVLFLSSSHITCNSNCSFFLGFLLFFDKILVIFQESAQMMPPSSFQVFPDLKEGEEVRRNHSTGLISPSLSILFFSILLSHQHKYIYIYIVIYVSDLIMSYIFFIKTQEHVFFIYNT